jgi:hypothetical protein
MTRISMTSAVVGALLGISALAATAAPAEKLAISLEMYGGATFYSGEIGNACCDIDTAPVIGGSATVNIPFSANWFGQVDFAGAAAFNGDDDNQLSNSFVGALHIGNRERGHHMIGLFGGGGVAVPESEDSGNLWFIGAEGQLELRDIVLYAQGGWLDSKEADGDDSDTFHDAWFLRGVGRFSINPSTFLQGEMTYADGEQDTVHYDMNVWGWGARIEHRLDSIENMSIFAAYDGARYDNISGSCCSDQGRFYEHTVRIGFNVHLFGSDGMTAIDTPSFGRMVAGGDTVD